jgi:hypothetical protein
MDVEERRTMAWLKIDDGFCEHPKIQPLSDKAFRLHVVAMCSCARRLTDGYLTRKDVDVCRVVAGKATRRHIVELEDAGLWNPTPDGWAINDYLRYNPSAEKIKAERQAAAERQGRSRAKRNGAEEIDAVDYEAIIRRDGLVCHLCGRSVSRSNVHFDHVIPLSKGGNHTADNIKVAHARCNLSKHNRVTASVTV